MSNYTDITVSPKSVNASLNSVAEFNCTAIANSFVWKANGVKINEGIGMITQPILLNETLNIFKSTLRIMASSTDNAAEIICIAVKVTPLSSDESGPALLLVQGTYLYNF